jgi:hypothetical protein
LYLILSTVFSITKISTAIFLNVYVITFKILNDNFGLCYWKYYS